MAEFNIRTLVEEDLKELAAFYTAFNRRGDDSDVHAARRQLRLGQRTEQLRWRALRNPWRRDDVPVGHVVEDDRGRIVGGHMIYALALRLGAERLIAGCSGDFFVDESARSQGFFMYRKYLGLREFDLHLATTCNEQSGLLWEKSRAAPVADSDREHLAPARLTPLIEEVALRRAWPAAPVHMLGPLERVARGIAPRRRRGVSIEPCNDWGRLADLAEQHDDASLLVTDRTPEYLAWSYADSFAREVLGRQVFTWTDASNQRGWFSVERRRRGRRRQIRTARLADFVGPADQETMSALLPAIVDMLRGDTDMLSIAGRIDLHPAASGLRCRRRDFPRPIAYLIARSRDQADLATRLVVVDADRV